MIKTITCNIDMNLEFNKGYWEEKFKSPDWYIKLEEELNEFIFPIEKDLELKKFRHKVYELAEEMLEKNQIPLAEAGPNFDVERKPIDTIIIHHTEEEPDIRLAKLSAIGFIRQYGLNYLTNDVKGNRLKGEPIWSGHFREDKMVFFAYHWLVRPDGTTERLLEDNYIGWHSGNWDINTRSAAIAFSGDFQKSTPPINQIEGAAKIIRENYSNINKNRILGHREVKKDRTCPGECFLSGWKETILKSI